MSTYKKLTISAINDQHKEIAQAFISLHEVDSIIEYDTKLEVFAEAAEYQNIIDALRTQELLKDLTYEITEHENKNWNALWESQFEPININGLNIRATFHEKDAQAEEEIVIAPKMAFGTGHHATTYMMLKSMKTLDLNGKEILDYGCGTGILSVYAGMKKAAHIDAIDIQPETESNFSEHLTLNNRNPDKYTFILGTLDKVKDKKYDVILANINRSVLLEKARELSLLMKSHAEILLSGILLQDEELVKSTFENQGLKCINSDSRGDWMLLHLIKND